MKLKLNDTVLVIAGKDRGKVGKIIKVIHKHGRIVVEKVNIRTKHVRKTAQRAGEKISFEASIDASNVMILDPKENKPTRIAYKILESGKKERISKLTGTSLDHMPVTATQKQQKGSAKKTEDKENKPKTSKTAKKTIKV